MIIFGMLKNTGFPKYASFFSVIPAEAGMTES
jgi:hypothetical protein